MYWSYIWQCQVLKKRSILAKIRIGSSECLKIGDQPEICNRCTPNNQLLNFRLKLFEGKVKLGKIKQLPMSSHPTLYTNITGHGRLLWAKQIFISWHSLFMQPVEVKSCMKNQDTLPSVGEKKTFAAFVWVVDS